MPNAKLRYRRTVKYSQGKVPGTKKFFNRFTMVELKRGARDDTGLGKFSYTILSIMVVGFQFSHDIGNELKETKFC